MNDPNIEPLDGRPIAEQLKIAGQPWTTPQGVKVYGAGTVIQAAEKLDEILPLDALELLRETREDIENLEGLAVVAARAGGATWDEIGKRLGTTRQAAHEKFRVLLKGK